MQNWQHVVQCDQRGGGVQSMLRDRGGDVHEKCVWWSGLM
jgi:hypothetical protein